MAYIGNVPAEKYIALTQQTFSSPTGTSFTLSQAVTNPVDIDLYIDNVKQDPASYSVSGTALTTSTIASPSTMYCIFNGKAMQTVNPPDDSVGLGQMASATDGNLITFDASGNPAYVATGSDGQVLTSTGAGSAPAFETLTTGKVIQVVTTQTGAVASTSTTIPNDDTIPTSSEGAEFMSLAITPTSATNRLIITLHARLCSSGALEERMLCLFQDSGSAALAVMSSRQVNQANAPNHMSLLHSKIAGTTSSTTFKMRAGSGGGTTTFNGVGGSREFGGAIASSITITEIAV
jgi:hypothetical protein